MLRKIPKCWLNGWVVFATGGDGIAAVGAVGSDSIAAAAVGGNDVFAAAGGNSIAAAADGVFAAAGDDDDDDGIAVTAADVSGDSIRDAAAVGGTDGDAGIIDDAATYFYKENLRFI